MGLRLDDDETVLNNFIHIQQIRISLICSIEREIIQILEVRVSQPLLLMVSVSPLLRSKKESTL